MHAPIYGYNTVVPESTAAALVGTSTQQSADQQTPIRTNFNTPEGVYRQTMTVNEYFRSSRMPNQVAGPVCNAPVRVSFLRISATKASSAEEVLPSTSAHRFAQNDVDFDYPISGTIGSSCVERICFNIGREIYVFDYSGMTSSDSSAKPVDKRVYKGTFPTCHDFCKEGATLHSCQLLIGFSAGQIQLIDPNQKEMQNSSKLFNEDRQIDRSAVTCLRWVPDGHAQFVASHSSGFLYLYNEELDSPPLTPSYQIIKQGEDFTVSTCKTKAQRNPLQRWQIGTGAINQFDFSGPSSNFMATVGQDGFLRVFDWRKMELLGCMKSYFGGLLCLAWSPDLRYIATGGEDDMLSLYSMAENRVVCRGQGHKSWISEVAFDTYATFASTCANDMGGAYDPTMTDEVVLSTSADSMVVQNAIAPSSYCRIDHHPQLPAPYFYQQQQPFPQNPLPNQNGYGGERHFQQQQQQNHKGSCLPQQTCSASSSMCTGGVGALYGNFNGANGNGGSELNSAQSRLVYRLGTVGHDCQLCLWDVSEDALRSSTPASYSQNSRLFGECTPLDASSPIGGFPAESPTGVVMNNARGTTVIPIGIDNAIVVPHRTAVGEQDGKSDITQKSSSDKDGGPGHKNGGSRFKRLHKRGLSLGSRLTGNDRNRQNGSSSNGAHSVDGTLRRGERHTAQELFGTPQCPRIEEVPVIEPLVCKKVANERLGSLHFREDCIVTACQEGYICTWARPSAQQRQDGRQPNLSMSDCPNECHHQLSAENFASTCV